MINGLPGKGIFFGNMKGGVGKSTLCMFTVDMLKTIKPELDIMMIDTDPQATSSLMMKGLLPEDRIRFMPIGDRFDGAVLSTIDGVIKSHLMDEDSIVIIDSAAGRIGNIWQVALLCNTMIIPTSLSWTDMAPTIDYIAEIDSRKVDYDSITPHIIVVPNRMSPNQKDYSQLYNKVGELNVVIAPPVCDYSVVRHSSHNFLGLKSVEQTRFYGEIEKLAQFITSHVLTGKLDSIYEE